MGLVNLMRFLTNENKKDKAEVNRINSRIKERDNQLAELKAKGVKLPPDEIKKPIKKVK